MKRINSGPEFLGKYWIYIIPIAGFLIGIFLSNIVAKYVAADSWLPALPILVVMVGVLAFFIYNYRRNN